MNRKLIVLLGCFVLVACANPERDPSDSDLLKKMKKAAKLVTVVNSYSSEWCSIDTKCKYLGDTNCDSGSSKAEKKCRKKIGKNVIKAGGDTYVVMSAGIIPGESVEYDKHGYYRSYGRVYNCSGKYRNLHEEYSREFPNYKLQQTGNVVSDEYFKRCIKKSKKCEFKLTESCGTIRPEPFKLCEKKLRTFPLQMGFDTTVVTRDLFNRGGVYRIFFNGYSCK